MGTDIHSKVFDNGTQVKLYILKEYLKEWLPVFLNQRETIWKKIFIYDFFAGEGSDIEGNIGSPLITLNELKPYCKRIRSEKIDVKVVFNEFLQKKSKKLSNQCNQLQKPEGLAIFSRLFGDYRINFENKHLTWPEMVNLLWRGVVRGTGFSTIP